MQYVGRLSPFSLYIVLLLTSLSHIKLIRKVMQTWHQKPMFAQLTIHNSNLAPFFFEMPQQRVKLILHQQLNMELISC